MLGLSTETVDRTLRPGLVGVYVLAVASGLWGLLYHPPSMLSVVGAVWSTTWAVFLFIGGAVCLAGVLVPRGRRGDWLGEYIGIWLVASAALLYGVVAAMTIGDEPGRGPGVGLLLAFALLLTVRWFRVRSDMLESRVEEQEHTTPDAVDAP